MGKKNEEKSDNTKHDTHLFGLLRIFFFSASLIKRKELWVYTKISYNVSRKNSRKKKSLVCCSPLIFIISSMTRCHWLFFTHMKIFFYSRSSWEHLSRDEMRANTTHWLDDVEWKLWWRKFCDIGNFRVFSLAAESGEWERERRENREKLKKFHIIICVARF